MAMGDCCRICNRGVEFVLHVLRDCPLIKSVWSRLLPSPVLGRFCSLSLHEWLLFGLKECSSVLIRDVKFPILFAVLCWKAWFRRNAIMFDMEFVERVDLLESSVSYVKEISRAKDGLPVAAGVSSARRESSRSWLAPPEVQA
ncbi:hypothetical protein V6N11_067710 [Hibiscus sabdariffa]|uniref:Reverse transcriptase zinc-binding domain-containing protein n=1 Tax=Hibiscus sabdariffa TaxID=183260 RepID=A0ABR2SSG9_9ROSI